MRVRVNSLTNSSSVSLAGAGSPILRQSCTPRTPGRCYDEAPNGNDSEIHWDMVMIQTPEYGGGEMHFDDERVRQDGLFVTDDLMPLNPDALK